MINYPHKANWLNSNRILFPCLSGTLGIGILATATYLASIHERFPGDLAASTWIQSWRTDWLDSVFRSLSMIGLIQIAATIMICITLVLIVANRKRTLSFHFIVLGSLFFASMTGFFIRTMLKLLVARPRPTSELVQIVEWSEGYSFPSGHVMFCTILFGSLYIMMVNDNTSHRVRSVILTTITVALVIVGTSRIYLGAHWMSDIIGAYIFGTIVLAIMKMIWNRSKPAPDR